MSTTIKKINAALKREGYKGEIVRGDGYHYFVGDDFDHAFSSSVCVPHTNSLSIERWLWWANVVRTESRERYEHLMVSVEGVPDFGAMKAKTYIH